MPKKNIKLKMLRTVSYICFLCVFQISSCFDYKDGNKSSSKSLSEGELCSQSGISGICKRIPECPIAIHQLKTTHRHSLQRCGFVGSDEVVCCPDIGDRNPTIESTTIDRAVIWSENGGGDSSTKNAGRIKTKRKCEIMCDKIRKDNNIKPDIEFHVLRGENAKPEQFPHMAALGFLDQNDQLDWRCGATLISSRFLLTAAHCVICSGCSDPVKARLGVVNITNNRVAQDIDVKQVLPSDKYDVLLKFNDIAIVELVKDVQMSKLIYPACLYTISDDPYGLLVTGWGQTDASNSSSRSEILQYGMIEPVPVDACNKTILTQNKNSAKSILNTQICATTASDACVGDSGGPLQIQAKDGGYNIVGIISYGVACGSNVPGVYTRVSAYLDWIEDIVWPT